MQLRRVTAINLGIETVQAAIDRLIRWGFLRENPEGSGSYMYIPTIVSLPEIVPLYLPLA